MTAGQGRGRPVRLASRNPGKLEELRALLAGSGWLPVPIPVALPLLEPGAGYEANALAKARLAAGDGVFGLGDDSGLEVAALAGGPGWRSAFWGGADPCGWLLAALRGVPPPDRRARFVAAVALVAPDGRAWLGRGELAGTVATCRAGSGGFGYDPVFIPAGSTMTLAQWPAEQKNRISHRARAVAAVLARVSADGLTARR